MSTLIFSRVEMNSGTWIVAPVSSVAGLVPPVDRSPCRPGSVWLTVSQTDPGVQGDRSTGGTKPATLETGAQIQVPLFITTGEKIRVDTRSGDYLGRA